MIGRLEFEGYKTIVEGQDTAQIMSGVDPEGISRLGAEMACYYARLSGELAEVKDLIDKEYLRLIKPVEEGGEGLKVTAAEKVAEVNTNAGREVTRREIEYLMKAVDKISFASSTRVRSFAKEGNF